MNPDNSSLYTPFGIYIGALCILSVYIITEQIKNIKVLITSLVDMGLSLLLFLLVVHMAAVSPTADFIKSSCRATRYPALCVQTLAPYATVIRQSERQLAITALSVTISKTRSCGSFVKNTAKTKGLKPREYGAVQDCIETVGDSVDRLSQSARELGRVGDRAVGEEFEWHMSNVQTWVSAALTNDNTCLDGFSGNNMNGKVKEAIRERVVYVAQVTSNALALVNRFASRHRS